MPRRIVTSALSAAGLLVSLYAASATLLENSSTLPGSCGAIAQEESAKYDPLKVDRGKVQQLTLEVQYLSGRERRIPIRVYLPGETSPCPVILFSHGLGGSRDNSPYLGNHWAACGYVAVFVQHLGSDESVWRNTPASERMSALRKAASAENFTSRTQDIPAVIDQLSQWNQDKEHELLGRMDVDRIGMSGHSFGAVTTQAVSGQSYLGRARYTDSRIKAALAMSPSTPQGTSADRAFGKVAIPWLLMTGTDDTSIIGTEDVESRLAVFPALPKGSKYELVLDGAEHSAFSDRALPGDRNRRNPNHHRAILALSTAFWDAFLKEDPAARAWLDGDGAKSVLEAADRWQTK